MPTVNTDKYGNINAKIYEILPNEQGEKMATSKTGGRDEEKVTYYP
jgi:hypothetical protein